MIHLLTDLQILLHFLSLEGFETNSSPPSFLSPNQLLIQKLHLSFICLLSSSQSNLTCSNSMRFLIFQTLHITIHNKDFQNFFSRPYSGLFYYFKIKKYYLHIYAFLILFSKMSSFLVL